MAGDKVNNGPTPTPESKNNALSIDLIKGLQISGDPEANNLIANRASEEMFVFLLANLNDGDRFEAEGEPKAPVKPPTLPENEERQPTEEKWEDWKENDTKNKVDLEKIIEGIPNKIQKTHKEAERG